MSDKLYDPGSPEIFVSGLGEVEAVGGGCYRFAFVTRTHNGEEVAVKLIAPMEAVPPAALLAMKAVGFCVTKGRYCMSKVH